MIARLRATCAHLEARNPPLYFLALVCLGEIVLAAALFTSGSLG